ncbi:MAG: GNAT family N-acetyltransferase [Marinilabiliaceae bacterium]|nr:GNAT family N-acetyltransferase [Marinilabiliaceae bacterium]
MIETIITPVCRDLIQRDIAFLKNSGSLLFSRSNYEVYLARKSQIPSIMTELGRLREISYREVGEGTNKCIDTDLYDNYYLHLFVYDANNHNIVGAYRLGLGDEILKNRGKQGFYISSLFSLGLEIDKYLSQCLELGRSFVVSEYQQKPMPLFLLWKGILHFLRENKKYRFLIGPLSISNDLSSFSKDILVEFVYRYHYRFDLAQHVKSSYLYEVKSNKYQVEEILDVIGSDFWKLDKFIGATEKSGMRVPVLLKQYLKQNAKIMAFNIDPNFNNSLDALMMLDLNDVPPETFSFLNWNREVSVIEANAVA